MNLRRWVLFLIAFSCVFAYSQEAMSKSIKDKRSDVSNDLAHVLWHVMKTYEGEYDFQELISILRELHEKKQNEKPLDRCYFSLMEVLEKKASEKAAFNLQTANLFLEKLEASSDVNEIVKYKLYYRVLKPGTGDSINSFMQSPLISFKEMTLSGDVISEYRSGIRIPLSETISGLQKGLKGIKVGEKREIFIHPDFAYGEFPKPESNSLIVIEVTLLSL